MKDLILVVFAILGFLWTGAALVFLILLASYHLRELRRPHQLRTREIKDVLHVI